MTYPPFRELPFRKMKPLIDKAPITRSPLDMALNLVAIPPAIRMKEKDFYYVPIGDGFMMHPLWRNLGNEPPLFMEWFATPRAANLASLVGYSHTTTTTLRLTSSTTTHPALTPPPDHTQTIPVQGKTDNITLRTGILNMTQPNFSVKTFDDLMAMRALTGVTRITEHHLVNRQSTRCFAHLWLVNGVRKPDYEKVVDFLKKADFFVEMRYDDPLGISTDTPSKGNADVSLNAYNISPTGLVKTLINVSIGSQLNVSVYQIDGEPTYIEEIRDLLSHRIVDKPIKLRYLSGFSSEGKPVIDVREIPKDTNRPLDSFYPTIPEGIVNLATAFEESSNNLLFMISEPGTGKSTLIREFCRIYKNRPFFQFAGDKVVNHPEFDAFLATLPTNAICIIEDAENLVAKRTEGNTTMALLLNEIDGIANKNIKFIISTNLENRKHVDEALFRPGRCFRTLEFGKLTPEQGLVICNEMQIDRSALLSRNAKFTLAELLADGGDAKIKDQAIGFQLSRE